MKRLIPLSLIAGFVVAVTAGFITVKLMSHTSSISFENRISMHRFTYIQPVFQSIHESSFKHLYIKCDNNLSSIIGTKKVYYIGTLLVSPKYLQVSLYRIANAGKPGLLVVYHVGGNVLWCNYTNVAALRRIEEGYIKLADNVQGYYKYQIYKARIPPPPLAIIASQSIASRVKAFTSSVTIYEYDVDGAIVYNFGSVGEYIVHLKGYVWVKEESNGNREVIGAEESGSYGERQGVMQYLFSECSFNAWAEYNKFAAFIKAKWFIAENVCPFPARYRGHPVLKLNLDGTIQLDPGGPSGGNELGCGCYGWGS